MSTNFPGPPHTMGFVGVFRAMGNWWENPCISHIMKYTTGWESNGKKSPILWEKYQYQFLRSCPYDGFCYNFLYYEKLMGKPMHFPYDEVYHRTRIRWEKVLILWEKHDYHFPRFSSYHGFCCIFPYYGKLMGKPMYLPYNEVYHRIGIR